jgi:hypothetical protein
MTWLLFIVSVLFAVSASAAPETLGLLPTQVARPLLEKDPGVSAARAMLEAARVEAGILEKSPYARLKPGRATANGMQPSSDHGACRARQQPMKVSPRQRFRRLRRAMVKRYMKQREN